MEMEWIVKQTQVPIRVLLFEVDARIVVVIGEKAWIGKEFGGDCDALLVNALTESGVIKIIDPRSKPRPEASVQDGAEGV